MQAAVVLDELLERGLSPELARIEGDTIVLRWELTPWAERYRLTEQYFSESLPRSAFRVYGLPQPVEPHVPVYCATERRWTSQQVCPCDRVVSLKWDAWYVPDFKRYGAELRLPAIWRDTRASYIHADHRLSLPADSGYRVAFRRLACPNCLFTVGHDGLAHS